MQYILTPGELVYVNSRSGLVPAKVVGRHQGLVRVRITGGRPGYRRGEVADHEPRHLVPRRAVCIRGHSYRIRPLGTPCVAQLPAVG